MKVRFRVLATFLFVAVSGVKAQAQDAWDCTLWRFQYAAKDETNPIVLKLHRQSNGWFGNGGWWYLYPIQDSEQALVAVRSLSGVDQDTFAPVIDVTALLIDKKTHHARLRYTFLTGYPDREHYGMCIPR